MPVFEIKSYNPTGTRPEHHFYVLCKGLNSGKPLNSPCANCFIVSAGTKEETETIYWLSFAMWKVRAFHPLLRGSVISFITIRDYRQCLASARQTIGSAPERLQKVVIVLKQLDEKEESARAQIKAICQLRSLVLQQLLKTQT